VIIGKKMKDGECHFLIRDSYGKGCLEHAWPCMKNAKDEAMGIWVSEKALINNLMEIILLPDPELKCTFRFNDKNEIFHTMIPNEVFHDQFYKFKTLPFKLEMIYDFQRKKGVFYLIFNTENSPIYLLDPSPEEGKNGVIFERELQVEDVGDFMARCEKYQKKMKAIKDINYGELFPKRRPVPRPRQKKISN
jgi:hypothetical protein